MENYKKYGIYLVVAVLIFLAGKYSSPPEVQVKEVEKVVYKEKQDYSRNITKSEIIRPDGTKEVKTKYSTKKKSDTSVDKETEKTTVVENRPNWRLGLIYQPGLPSYQWSQDEMSTLVLERHFDGEIYVGASYSTKNTLGLSISIGF